MSMKFYENYLFFQPATKQGSADSQVGTGREGESECSRMRRSDGEREAGLVGGC